jgi:hypothetical protein
MTEITFPVYFARHRKPSLLDRAVDVVMRPLSRAILRRNGVRR